MPTDDAFDRLSIRLMDEIMASETGIKLLLHHFVEGRLYNKDLKHGRVLETIGGGVLKVGETGAVNFTE